MNDEVPPLILAAEAGDVQQLNALLATGCDVDIRDPRRETKGQTPLMRAAATGQLEAVEVLLTNGAEVNAKSAESEQLEQWVKVTLYHAGVEAAEEAGAALGWTALHLAVRESRVNVVRRLLAAGADPDAKTLFKASPIHTAVEFNCREALDVLLEAGAPVNSRGSSNNTALHEAAFEGRDEFVERLLESGKSVKIDLKNADGHTPLMVAIEQGQLKCMRVLLQHGASLTIKNRQGTTAAEMADEAGGATRKAFFEATQAVKPQLTLGQFYEAIRDADCDRVRDAVERPDALDLHATHQGWAALPTAVLFANEETLRLLLAAGIDPNQRNATEFDDADEFRGVTALMMTVLGRRAGSSRMRQMQEMLLEANADVNAPDAAGWTILMHEAARVNLAGVQLWLERGADATYTNADGDSALSAMRIQWPSARMQMRYSPQEMRDQVDADFEELCALLRSAGAPDRPEIEYQAFDAECARDDTVIPRLLSEGLNPNTTTRRGSLVWLCVHGNMRESALALLRAGADPKQTSGSHGKVPLFIAVQNNDVEMVRTMLKRGADVRVEQHETNVFQYINGTKAQRQTMRSLLEEAAPDLATQRGDLGVMTFDANYQTLLVKAGGRRVAQSLAKLLGEGAKSWQPREGLPNIRGFVVLAWTDNVEPLPWATVHPLRNGGDRIYGRDFAAKLSADAKCDVILFTCGDTAGYAGYDYYRKGDRVEYYQSYPEDSVSFDGDPILESKLRKLKSVERSRAFKFIHESFTEFKAFVPPLAALTNLDDAGDRLRQHFVVKEAE